MEDGILFFAFGIFAGLIAAGLLNSAKDNIDEEPMEYFKFQKGKAGDMGQVDE